jgi:hypothetical protein
MIRILCILFLLSPLSVLAQEHHIKIHFLYGSRPEKGFKGAEKKHFGGIKGGHVNIESDGRVLDFMPGNNPLFPNKKKPSGGFRVNKAIYWDTSNTKWITIVVPVTPEQKSELDRLIDTYSEDTPYDYAIFGMRCAAASYDVLSEIGLWKEIPNTSNIIKNFYPKLLRKRIIKWANDRNYTVLKHEGRSSRKWESDKGLL